MPVARILFGVTGGIAAYKACELVRLLVKQGHDVVPLVDARRRALRPGRDFWALARKAAERIRTPISSTPTCWSSRR